MVSGLRFRSRAPLLSSVDAPLPQQVAISGRLRNRSSENSRANAEWIIDSNAANC
jgi:hypothetical protein